MYFGILFLFKFQGFGYFFQNLNVFGQFSGLKNRYIDILSPQPNTKVILAIRIKINIELSSYFSQIMDSNHREKTLTLGNFSMNI